MKANKGTRSQPTLRQLQEIAAEAERAARARELTAAFSPEQARARMVEAFTEALRLQIVAKEQARALEAADIAGWHGKASRPTTSNVRNTNLAAIEASAALSRAHQAFEDAVTVAIGHRPAPSRLEEPGLVTKLLEACWPFQHLFQLSSATMHADELLFEFDNERGASRQIFGRDLAALNSAASGISNPQRTEAA